MSNENESEVDATEEQNFTVESFEHQMRILKKKMELVPEHLKLGVLCDHVHTLMRMGITIKDETTPNWVGLNIMLYDNGILSDELIFDEKTEEDEGDETPPTES